MFLPDPSILQHINVRQQFDQVFTILLLCHPCFVSGDFRKLVKEGALIYDQKSYFSSFSGQPSWCLYL